jgi:hypothetical protein
MAGSVQKPMRYSNGMVTISYTEFVRELKGMVERNNIEGLQEQLALYWDNSEIPWDSLFKDVYLHACLKKKPDVIQWLQALYETMPVPTSVACRNWLPFHSNILS